jgi:hypothetical protein
MSLISYLHKLTLSRVVHLRYVTWMLPEPQHWSYKFIKFPGFETPPSRRNGAMSTASQRVQPLLCCCLHRRISAPSSLPVPSCVGFMHRASRAGPLPQCLTNTKKRERLESVQVKKDSMWDPRSFYMADWRTYYAFKLSILNWYLIPILHNTNG